MSLKLVSQSKSSVVVTPLLSIVIPVYNGEAYIEGCLNSIQAALSKLDAHFIAEVELIICDNRSTDRTLEIVKNFTFTCPNRIIQPPEFYDNRTLNWAYGLASACGTWMMMLHADDLMAAGGLVAMLAACREQLTNRKVVLLQGRQRTFTDPATPNRVAPIWPFKAIINGDSLDNAVLPLICPFVPFIIMRRSAYQKVDGFNSHYELVQDWDLWMRLLKIGDLYYYPAETGWWRLNNWSPKYTALNAKEHLEFAANLAVLNPDLSFNAHRFAIKAQIAKIKNWLPDVKLETLAVQASVALPAAYLQDFSSSEVQLIFKQMNRRMAVQFYRLRVIGTLSWLGFRLIQTLKARAGKKTA